MKKILYVLVFLFIINLKVFSADFLTVDNENKIAYSPILKTYSLIDISSNKIILTKNQRTIFYNDSFIHLNSDYVFIYNGRLFGINNDKLTYYEFIFENNTFKEVVLTYNQLQSIFSDIDVIKLSDFRNGEYRVLNFCMVGNKDVFLFNDIEGDFSDYVVTPSKFIANPMIKGQLRLPRWGKVTFSPKELDEEKPSFKIRVR